MIRSEHSLLIATRAGVAWALLVDVDGWPSWQPDVDAATIDGDFVPGTSFTWSSGGLDIVSTLEVVEPLRRIRWSGPAGDIWGVHTWTLQAQGGSVLVATEETWDGAPIDADPVGAQRLLDGSLSQWLQLLAAAARGRSVEP